LRFEKDFNIKTIVTDSTIEVSVKIVSSIGEIWYKAFAYSGLATIEGLHTNFPGSAVAETSTSSITKNSKEIIVPIAAI
jgi:hypothetical protein